MAVESAFIALTRKAVPADLVVWAEKCPASQRYTSYRRVTCETLDGQAFVELMELCGDPQDKNAPISQPGKP
jgi:hypothetical protein